ncbi:SixA phosphatase family protein [Salmonirosea aquatica]|uniref:Phosphohistidine phosphatase n=1 Tax=Salmonirosea aquatica TaxID=2654236 RepID=A0A7C9BA81_9BACT|nr:phosphohistidine phosphatase [Cytophagaceae bacterium SJW1-29]
MKKTLLLVRHAKAEDQSKMFKDFDRELLGSGIMDSARLGHFLKAEGVAVDSIRTSSAARTYQTAKIIAEQLKYEVDQIEAVDKLYSGGPQAYLAVVNATPETVATLLVCGHNPDINYFAEYLTHADVGSMEKCSMVTVEFEDLTWAEISAKSGTLKNYLTPQSLKDRG